MKKSTEKYVAVTPEQADKITGGQEAMTLEKKYNDVCAQLEAARDEMYSCADPDEYDKLQQKVWNIEEEQQRLHRKLTKLKGEVGNLAGKISASGEKGEEAA